MKKELLYTGLGFFTGALTISAIYKIGHRDIKKDEYLVDDYISEDSSYLEGVLNMLQENADTYDSVSVADYYDLIGGTCDYKDNGYGWFAGNIKKAKVIKTRGGYVIKFPPVEVI